MVPPRIWGPNLERFVVERIVAFYDAPGKPQNAAEWRAKLAETEVGSGSE